MGLYGVDVFLWKDIKNAKKRKKLRISEKIGFSTFLFYKIDILGVKKIGIKNSRLITY